MMESKRRTVLRTCRNLSAAAALLVLTLPPCRAEEKPLNPELKVYTDFLAEQHTTAEEYILGLFEDYDIVILCERDHREMTQYDLILKVLGNNYFTQHAGSAYFEIGSSLNNDRLNDFLRTCSLPPEQVPAAVLAFQRDAYGAALWEKANYSHCLAGVYRINRTLPAERRLAVYNLDMGIDWSTATERQIRERDDAVAHHRDSLLAANFIRLYRERPAGGKALVVLNYRHAFVKDLFGRNNAGRYIADAFPGRVANVYINSFALERNPATQGVEIVAVADGKWDASFRLAGKDDLGFDFAGTPFGNDRLDIIPFESDHTFADFFTGFVYYTPFPDLRSVTGIEGFVDDEFAPELMRRFRLESKVYGNELPTVEELKERYNTVEDKRYRESPEQFGKALGQIDRWFE